MSVENGEHATFEQREAAQIARGRRLLIELPIVLFVAGHLLLLLWFGSPSQ